MFRTLTKRLSFTFLAIAMLLAGLVALTGSARAAGTTGGFVYTETNAASGNAVLVYARQDGGSLALTSTIATGGLGSGAGLGSAGALAISADGEWLFAVNAGSNDISVIELSTGQVTDRVSSGGQMPISVTVSGNLVYVLNAGSDNITGFSLSSGMLIMIPNSTRPLSGSGVGGAQVAFTPDGAVLVVTEKATNLIDTYTLNDDGTANGPITHASSGAVPFGFAFAGKHTLVVSEAAVSAASSYRIPDSGNLRLVSGSVVNGQVAACWVATTSDGKFAYTADAHNGMISSYHVGKNGRLTLLNGAAGSPGGAPLDEVVTGNDGLLYVLNPALGMINAFTIASDGSLGPATGTSGIPASAAGLVAY